MIEYYHCTCIFYFSCIPSWLFNMSCPLANPYCSAHLSRCVSFFQVGYPSFCGGYWGYWYTTLLVCFRFASFFQTFNCQGFAFWRFIVLELEGFTPPPRWDLMNRYPWWRHFITSSRYIFQCPSFLISSLHIQTLLEVRYDWNPQKHAIQTAEPPQEVWQDVSGYLCLSHFMGVLHSLKQT